LESYKLIKQT